MKPKPTARKRLTAGERIAAKYGHGRKQIARRIDTALARRAKAATKAERERCLCAIRHLRAQLPASAKIGVCAGWRDALELAEGHVRCGSEFEGLSDAPTVRCPLQNRVKRNLPGNCRFSLP